MPSGFLCFLVPDAGDAEAVRVPDGAGGSVSLPLRPAPVVGDSGGSTSATNDVDLEIDVNVQNGEVVRVERRADKGTQAALGTLAALLLVLVAAACGALGVRRYGRGR